MKFNELESLILEDELKSYRGVSLEELCENIVRQWVRDEISKGDDLGHYRHTAKELEQLIDLRKKQIEVATGTIKELTVRLKHAKAKEAREEKDAAKRAKMTPEERKEDFINRAVQADINATANNLSEYC